MLIIAHFGTNLAIYTQCDKMAHKKQLKNGAVSKRKAGDIC